MASCSKKRKNEDTKQSCYFGKHLQEECHQKTKAEVRLFSDFTDKDKAVYKWRAGLPVTEDSVTTICFSKNIANVATSMTVTKRKRSQM